jgi:hypothetical protein
MQAVITPDMFRHFGLDPVLDYEPTPWGGMTFVSDKRILWSRGWISLVDPTPYEKDSIHVRMITFLPNGGLVGIAGDRIAAWSNGLFRVGGDKLPNAAMSIAPNPKDPYSLFVYGGVGKGQNGVYRWANGHLMLLCDTQDLVTAFVATSQALYYAVGPVIYRQIPNENPHILLRLDRILKKIDSMAIDERNRILYASSDDAITGIDFSGSNRPNGFVVAHHGGQIRLVGKKIYLLDKNTGTLIAFRELENHSVPKDVNVASLSQLPKTSHHRPRRHPVKNHRKSTALYMGQ